MTDNEETDGPEDNTPNRKYSFHWYNILLSVFGMAVYVGDVVTDILLAVKFHSDGHWRFFGLTVTFIALPALVITVYSLGFYVENSKKKENITKCYRLRLILIFLLMGPLVSFFEYLLYGMKLKRAKIKKKSIEKSEVRVIGEAMHQRDVYCITLRLVEAFLESAPQTILQLYIVTQPDSGNNFSEDMLAVTSISFSVISLAKSLTAHVFQYGIQETDSTMKHYTSYAVWFCHTLLFTASRMFSVGLFCSRYPYWTIGILAFRWLFSSAWHTKEEYEEDPKQKCQAFLSSCITGALSLYTYQNVSRSHFTKRLVAFYFSIFLEDVILIGVWYASVEAHLWYRLPAVIGTITAFFVGILFLLPDIFVLRREFYRAIWKREFKKKYLHPDEYVETPLNAESPSDTENADRHTEEFPISPVISEPMENSTEVIEEQTPRH